jgi:hypothetical protein
VKHPLTFKRALDTEGDKNRGWRVDRLDAFLHGQEVGYLKMSYIPSDRFRRYYPTIFNYMDQILGKHVLPYDRRTALYVELFAPELKKLLWYSQHGWSSTEPEGTRVELLRMATQRERELLEGRLGKSFKQFKAFHVNKPIVDYINVDVRRQGIGTALYFEGARWMSERRMKLYRSGIQTDEAKMAWNKFTQDGNTGEDRRGMFLIAQ